MFAVTRRLSRGIMHLAGGDSASFSAIGAGAGLRHQDRILRSSWPPDARMAIARMMDSLTDDLEIGDGGSGPGHGLSCSLPGWT
jgi:hypothetical protein